MNTMMKNIISGLITLVLVLALVSGAYLLIREIRKDLRESVVIVQQPQVVVQEQNHVQPQTALIALPDKTYYPEHSCSDLASCTITKVPEGLMTVGFIRVDRGIPDHNCGYAVFKSGQIINYDNLNEIHTYSGNLPEPGTTMDSFVNANMPYVHACN